MPPSLAEKLNGVVEVDETYIGPRRERGAHGCSRKKGHWRQGLRMSVRHRPEQLRPSLDQYVREFDFRLDEGVNAFSKRARRESLTR